MHHSQLAGFIIDCRDPDDLRRAAEFWGGALGWAVRDLPGEEGRYVKLEDPAGRLHVEVQAVRHDSRVHLDIETDDVDAEAARLESLGARRVGKVNTWWVMEAPTGHRFCVVRSKRKDLATTATAWER